MTQKGDSKRRESTYNEQFDWGKETPVRFGVIERSGAVAC
jgi:hypothetical protein